MFQSPQNRHLPQHERSARIEEIVASVIRQKSDVALDDAEIERQYPELMPELRESLHTARAIQAAAEMAKQQTPLSSASRDLGFLGGDDIAWLEKALPEFQILGRLDCGGQGTVFKAVQRAANRTVAIKFLLNGALSSQRQRDRFAREVDLISKLRHPNIVTLFESGVVCGRPFFAMEFVDGLPIDDYMLLHQPPVDDCVRLFSKVCRAVSYAHQRGIIHRDLKPANILVDLDGEPRILDFGLAKSTEDAYDAGEAHSLSMAGQVFGTLPYLSPEQASGSPDEIDVRSDIYALGVILYRLLTRAFPYPVNGEPETVRANILTREPLSLRHAMNNPDWDICSTTGMLSDDLERIVLKTLSKDKVRRYQSAAAFADDLDRFLAGDAVQAKADSSLYILRKTISKYRVHTAVAIAFSVVLGASSILITVQWMKARDERDNARQVALLAHSTLNEVVTDFEEAVRPLAGGVEVRDRLLEHVDAKLERLRPFVESDAEMEGLLAALREKQGDIAYAQGRHGDAERHYQVFLDINQRLAGGDTPNDEALLQMARAHRKLAEVSDDAETHYLRAIELGESLVSHAPVAAEPKHELCSTHIAYGQRLYDNGRFDIAVEHAEAAIEIAEPASSMRTDNDRWPELLATAYGLNGRIQTKLGNAALGLRSLQTGLSLRERMSQQRPSDIRLRQGLFLSYLNVGKCFRDSGRIDQAKSLLEKAVALGGYITQVDPTAIIWKRDLYSAHDCLARLLLASGDTSQAQQHCTSAVELAKHLVEVEPDDVEWRRILAFSHYLHGRVMVAQDKFQSAFEDFQNAANIQKDIASEDPGNLALKSELARSYDGLGRCARNLGEADQALACYQAAYETREQLLQMQPDMTKRILDVIVSQTKLAAWYLDLNTAEGDQTACDLLVQAESSLVALSDAGKLSGQESAYDAIGATIKANQHIIAKRAEETSKAAEAGASSSN